MAQIGFVISGKTKTLTSLIHRLLFEIGNRKLTLEVDFFPSLKTVAALRNTFHHSKTESMITEQQFAASAQSLRVEVAAIKAVAEVESSGEGFLSNGKPKILFEPHIFWKQLRAKGINPTLFMEENADILYPTWKAGAYGPVSKQHERLERASKINRDAALMSASWGKFQIMGFNWKLCGSASLQEFVNNMYESEDKHLHLFTIYIKSTFLDDELRNHDWAGFARGYNGPQYVKNRYDTKLKNAYLRYKAQVATQ